MNDSIQKIAMISENAYLNDTHLYETKYLFDRTGFNTGNLVYWYAVQKHLTEPKDYFGWNADTDKINSDYKALVFPAANNLYQNSDMSPLANLFEKIEIPLIVTGLGAQNKNIGDPLHLTKGTQRFLHVIKEKCDLISVRGEYTAEVLHDYGVDNVVVTGCPSNFINPDPVPDNFMNVNIANIHKVIVNMNIHQNMSQEIKKVVALLSNILKYSIVVQDPGDQVEIARTKNFSDKSAFPSFLKKILSDITDVDDLLYNHLDTFFSIDTWLEHIKHYDLALGTRMHGNMLAFQSRIPTIFITHDSRVTEMIDTMKLPYIDQKILLQSTSFDNLLEAVWFDAEEYNKTRTLLARRYCDMFAKHHIKLDPKILCI